MRTAYAIPSISDRRRVAAREALALCASADALAREAADVGLEDDNRLLALLQQREDMLQDLAEQLVILKSERPAADSALYATTERMVDEADALVAQVYTALTNSHQATIELTAKVARRAEEIRAELDAVQRTSAASATYGGPRAPRLVDRVR